MADTDVSMAGEDLRLPAGERGGGQGHAAGANDLGPFLGAQDIGEFSKCAERLPTGAPLGFGQGLGVEPAFGDPAADIINADGAILFAVAADDSEHRCV